MSVHHTTLGWQLHTIVACLLSRPAIYIIVASLHSHPTLVRSMKAFCCRSGRQFEPNKTSYDALLFALRLSAPPQLTLWETLSGWVQQPVRSLAGCGPWAACHQVHRYQGNASRCEAVSITQSSTTGAVGLRGSAGHEWLERLFVRGRSD